VIVGVDNAAVEGMNVGMIEGMDDNGCAEGTVDGDSVGFTDGLIVGEPAYIGCRI
jgi:hypothetical protein